MIRLFSYHGGIEKLVEECPAELSPIYLGRSKKYGLLETENPLLIIVSEMRYYNGIIAVIGEDEEDILNNFRGKKGIELGPSPSLRLSELLNL